SSTRRGPSPHASRATSRPTRTLGSAARTPYSSVAPRPWTRAGSAARASPVSGRSTLRTLGAAPRPPGTPIATYSFARTSGSTSTDRSAPHVRASPHEPPEGAPDLRQRVRHARPGLAACRGGEGRRGVLRRAGQPAGGPSTPLPREGEAGDLPVH